jgi:hypothetical protein
MVALVPFFKYVQCVCNSESYQVISVVPSAQRFDILQALITSSMFPSLVRRFHIHYSLEYLRAPTC